MTIEKYRELRHSFIKQYKALPKSNLGTVKINHFKIFNLKEFLWLYSMDNHTAHFSNTVSSIEPKKYHVRTLFESCDKILIRDMEKSMFDKFPEQFKLAQSYYHKSLQKK